MKKEIKKQPITPPKKTRKQRIYEKHPHIVHAWFWLTCWRPTIKYELANMAKSVIMFANTNHLQHAKMRKDIDELMKIYQYKKIEDKKEAEERGVYG